MADLRLRLSEHTSVGRFAVARAGRTVKVADAMLVAALQSGVPAVGLQNDLDGPAGPTLQALHRIGALAWELPGLVVAEVGSTGTDLRVPVPMPGPIPLSRFAVVHRARRSVWRLESGISRWRLTLTEDGVRRLTGPDDTGWFAGLLAATDMLDDGDERARGWSMHDALFISRTRDGELLRDPTDRARGIAPQPVFADPLPSQSVPLPRPSGPGPGEPTLWEATESRRTVRDFSPAPVTRSALGALLWRTLRVQTTHDADDGGEGGAYSTILRPVPSGGAMHASDLWLLCRDVEGVAPGVYRYEAQRHCLVLGVEALPPGLPAPIVGVITVRHRRTAWKYEPFALSLELKDLGVQMMALQLSAPAVGLAMVPIGNGSTHQLGKSLDIDVWTDAPIGEFLLGVLPD